MPKSMNIHFDETQPMEIKAEQSDNAQQSNVEPDDETIPILIFQNKMNSTPSWWQAAIAKAAEKKRWWKWRWVVYFGVLAFIGMSVFSLKTLTQKHRDVHLVISNVDSFFDDADGWATINGVRGIRTQQGILFEQMEVGQHKITIGFDNPSCPKVRQQFQLNIGKGALTLPLKEWYCSNNA